MLEPLAESESRKRTHFEEKRTGNCYRVAVVVVSTHTPVGAAAADAACVEAETGFVDVEVEQRLDVAAHQKPVVVVDAAAVEAGSREEGPIQQ